MLIRSRSKYLYRGGLLAVWAAYDWRSFGLGINLETDHHMTTLTLAFGPLQIDFDFGDV